MNIQDNHCSKATNLLCTKIRQSILIRIRRERGSWTLNRMSIASTDVSINPPCRVRTFVVYCIKRGDGILDSSSVRCVLIEFSPLSLALTPARGAVHSFKTTRPWCKGCRHAECGSMLPIKVVIFHISLSEKRLLRYHRGRRAPHKDFLRFVNLVGVFWKSGKVHFSTPDKTLTRPLMPFIDENDRRNKYVTWD